MDNGAWSRHGAINNNRLTTITEARCKPLKSSVSDSKGHLLPLQKNGMIERVEGCAEVWQNNQRERETSLSSAFINKQSRTLSTAVSVLWSFLYADWCIFQRLLSDMCFWSCFKTIFPRTFEINDRFGTGLKCSKSSVLSPAGFFKSGMTTLCLNCLVTVPVERVMNGTKSFRHCFVREVGIGSNMQLLVGDRKISSQVSLSENGSKWESMGPSYTAKEDGSHKSLKHHAECLVC